MPIFADGFESGDYFAWSQAVFDTPDNTPPSLTITAPVAPVLFNEHIVPIELVYSDDDSGVALNSLAVHVDGIPITSSCAIQAGTASCESFYLGAGSHSISASIWDQAGHRTDAARSVTIIRDISPPVITLITPPEENALFATPTLLVTGTVSDADEVADVLVSAEPIPLTDDPPQQERLVQSIRGRIEGDTFSGEVPLGEGLNLVVVRAFDRAGNEAVVSRFATRDSTAPTLAIESPQSGAVVNVDQVLVTGQAFDEAHEVTLSVGGVPTPLDLRSFAATVPLSEGMNAVLVEVIDEAGNTTSETLQVERLTIPTVTITSPTYGTRVGVAAVEVLGTVSDPNASVRVNGVVATTGGGTFQATIPLNPGGTLIAAVATSASGAQATSKTKVFRDLSAPRIAVTSPADGSTVHQAAIPVVGLVNDVVPGTVDAVDVNVWVNGQPAQVANRSFLLPDLVLSPGDNDITVTAEDVAGNLTSETVTVHYEPLVGARIERLSGNLQSAVIETPVGAPLVVRVLDPADQPVEGAVVVFRVAQGNGSVGAGSRTTSVLTDANGEAATPYQLGTRAGVGNQRVIAEAAGYVGSAEFLATALPGPPAYLHVDAGGQQRGAALQLLPDPMSVVVTDAGFNRLPGIEVEYQVAQGQAVFEETATPTLSMLTDADGRAAAQVRLGAEEGVANVVIEVALPGNPTASPATFVASTFAAGNPALTRISGIVLDNASEPVPGVTLSLAGTSHSTQANEDGLFSLAGVPVGTFHLEADGSTATRPGTWPHLEFEITTIPGRENTLGMPIFLLPLDTERGLQVSATEGGTLTLPELPGFSLTVDPGSVTFPDGTQEGTVSVTLVHGDKVPKVPNFGQQPTFLLTIQPAGALFDPPASLSMPNVDALAPGTVTELYSFDHDLGSFVSIGPGTVSEDGTMVVADPGVGILKAGWHCGGNPAPTGTPHDCPQCKVCDGSRCVPGCDLEEGTEPAPVLGETAFEVEGACLCDDGNPCTFNDRCDTGPCIGTHINIDSVLASVDGGPGPLELPLVGTSTREVEFVSQPSPSDHGCPDLRYTWQTGDGGYYRDSLTLHSYSRVGTFKPTATITCGSCPFETASKTLDVEVFPLAIRLEQEGDIEISTDGKYTEDATIRVTAVNADTGEVVEDFQGMVSIEERPRPRVGTVYDKFAGELPAAVQITAGGTATFLARSQVNHQSGRAPTSALLTVPDMPLYGGQELEVEQWVDTGPVDPRSQGAVYDWLEHRLRDLFVDFSSNLAVNPALETISHYEVDENLSAVGQTQLTHTPTSVVVFNPLAATNMRVPGTQSLSRCSDEAREDLAVTLIHEARHSYHDYLTTLDLAAPDDFDGRPNNDDDQDWLVEVVPAGLCPCDFLVDTSLPRNGCDYEAGNGAGLVVEDLTFLGDAIVDDQIEAFYVWEMDAVQFSIQHSP
ncbi:MAG: carboxypeptidase regulatory-like domain-containing protein [Acidobacteriota bacterium]|nr:carboxypeptidase regulatory-like domain-containing protein [Acidobacteriota bacterium]